MIDGSEARGSKYSCLNTAVNLERVERAKCVGEVDIQCRQMCDIKATLQNRELFAVAM